jgi:Kef-type K+ transport system membrane component KefB
LAGVVIGPNGIGIVSENHPLASFLSELGILLLMFSAGLEIDLALFQRAKHKAYMFGVVTAVFPFLLGLLVARFFGYATVPAIAIGSLLASHTLVGLPIISRLGETRYEPVTVAIGATAVSDTLSLLVFALCASTFRSGFSPLSLSVQLLEIAIFVPFILIGLSRAGAWLLNKVEQDEAAYFVVMLGILVVAALIADTIHLPDIVGAFLAGLAVNAAVQEKAAKEKLMFFGTALFIPCFFIVTGFLIAPVIFARTLASHFALALCIVLAAVVGKGISSEVAGRVLGYTPLARKTMWSLTLPQVAATLAATLVGTHTFNNSGQPMIDHTVLNVVLVLVLTTSILGPVLTERFGTQMLPEATPPTRMEPVTSK